MDASWGDDMVARPVGASELDARGYMQDNALRIREFRR